MDLQHLQGEARATAMGLVEQCGDAMRANPTPLVGGSHRHGASIHNLGMPDH